jgi:hypothetical protein
MKRLIEGMLFVAMFIAALAMGGSEEPQGMMASGAVFSIVAALMWKSGMMAKPISKEKYEQCYGEKK